MRSTLVATFLLMVVLLMSGGCASNGPMSGSGSAESAQVTVKILSTGVRPEVVDSFEIGQPVRVKETGSLVGTITSIESTLGAVSLGDSEGDLHVAQSPITRDIVLTVEGEATVSEEGYEFEDTFLHVNDNIVFLTPYTLFTAKPIRMEPKED